MSAVFPTPAASVERTTALKPRGPARTVSHASSNAPSLSDGDVLVKVPAQCTVGGVTVPLVVVLRLVSAVEVGWHT